MQTSVAMPSPCRSHLTFLATSLMSTLLCRLRVARGLRGGEIGEALGLLRGLREDRIPLDGELTLVGALVEEDLGAGLVLLDAALAVLLLPLLEVLLPEG